MLSLTSIIAAENEMIPPANTFAMIKGPVMETIVLTGLAPTLEDASSRLTLVCWKPENDALTV